jgi:hypothetical protein
MDTYLYVSIKNIKINREKREKKNIKAKPKKREGKSRLQQLKRRRSLLHKMRRYIKPILFPEAIFPLSILRC